jgi:hypothetical protein
MLYNSHLYLVLEISITLKETLYPIAVIPHGSFAPAPHKLSAASNSTWLFNKFK